MNRTQTESGHEEGGAWAREREECAVQVDPLSELEQEEQGVQFETIADRHRGKWAVSRRLGPT